MKARFAALPMTVEELEDSIAEKRAEGDGIVCANPRALEEYTNRARMIKTLTEKLETEAAALAESQDALTQLRVRLVDIMWGMV